MKLSRDAQIFQLNVFTSDKARSCLNLTVRLIFTLTVELSILLVSLNYRVFDAKNIKGEKDGLL
jgi:hypothetical protein